MKGRLVLGVLLALAVTASPARAVAPDRTVLVSLPDGATTQPAQGSGDVRLPDCCDHAVSADGSRVLLRSDADALAPGMPDRLRHLFVRDTTTGTTRLVDRAGGAFGTKANAEVGAAAISADGRYVAFVSSASNLVGGFVPEDIDEVYLRDLEAETTTLVSVSANGSAASLLSRDPGVAVRSLDGHVVVTFITRAFAQTPGRQAYVRDVTAGTTTLLSHRSGMPESLSSGMEELLMSPDGNRVAFRSTQALASDGSEGDTDVFARSTLPNQTSVVELTNTTNGLINLGALSNAGVAIFDSAENLVAGDTDGTVDVYRAGGSTTLLTPGNSTGPVFSSAHGISVNATQVLVSSSDPLLTGVNDGLTRAVLIPTGGGPPQVVSRADGVAGATVSITGAALAPGAGHVVFSTGAPQLSEPDDGDYSTVALRDVAAGRTQIVARPDGAGALLDDGAGSSETSTMAVSADGRHVAFVTGADAIAGDSRVRQAAVRDVLTGRTTVISASAGGALADQAAANPVVSADGRFAAFNSMATNLVPGADVAVERIYVRDLTTGELAVVARGVEPTLAGDGSRVAFRSSHALLAEDTNQRDDVYVAGRDASGLSLVSRSAEGLGNGHSSGAVFSRDGRRVAFTSGLSNLAGAPNNALPKAFLRDLVTGELLLISRAADGTPADSSSAATGIDADGSHVLFSSSATNLAANAAPGTVYLRDVAAGTNQVVSVGPGSATGVSGYGPSALSGDATRVAFATATNLVPEDSDSMVDVYLRDVAAGRTVLASRADGPDGAATTDTRPGIGAALSADGHCVVWSTDAPGLTPSQASGSDFTHVFLRSVGGECAPAPATPEPTPTASPTASATPAPTPTVTPDRTAPAITRASLSLRRFRRSRRTQVRATLSEAATMVYAIARELPGRRVGRRCVRQTRANRRRPRCTRLVAAGTLRRAHPAGALRFTLNRRLAAGRYRVTLVATDAAGNRSRAVVLRFTVTR